MIETAPIVFVCTTRKWTTLEWSLAEPRFRVLYTTVPSVVLASVRGSSSPGSDEVSAVIFDQSIEARSFLGFLSDTPSEFRGDALMINSDGSAILSSVSSRDGRHIYQLTADDVVFWATARLGLQTIHAATLQSGRRLARTA